MKFIKRCLDWAGFKTVSKGSKRIESEKNPSPFYGLDEKFYQQPEIVAITECIADKFNNPISATTDDSQPIVLTPEVSNKLISFNWQQVNLFDLMAA